MKKSLFFLALTLGLVLIAVGRKPVGAHTIGQTLSTPQIIGHAYEAGQITEGERILYLAYAIYEHESLPPQFEGTANWFGSEQVQEIYRAYEQSRSTFTPEIQAELDRLINNAAATICDRDDLANNTTSTNFYYNYGTISGGLTISDYTMSMESAFTTIVSQYGWAKPPYSSNNNLGGTGVGLYPVQIAAIGGSLFGYVTPNVGDGNYTQVVGDNPNTTAVETASTATCMVLNNDFSQFSGNTPQENLDATTSHEYVHSIQFAYGDPGDEEDAFWFESVAAYFEDEMSDSANSANQYLWPVVTNCFGQWPNDGDPSEVSQYSGFLFFRHIAENAGGANAANAGENVVQALWENIGQNQNGLQAMDNALQAASPATNLNDAFHNYAIALKNSASCSGGYAKPYCFDEGADYRASDSNVPAFTGSISANPGTYSGSVSEHYAINYVSIPVTSNAFQIQLANTATSGIGQLRASHVCDTGSGITTVPLSGVASNGQTVNATVNNSSCTTASYLVITNQGTTVGTEPTACAATGYTVSLGAPLSVQLQDAGNATSAETQLQPLLVAFAIFFAATVGIVWLRRA